MRCSFKILFLIILFTTNGFSQDPFGVTGTYKNRSYGFQVTIPKGLTGHWNSPIWKDSTTGNYISMSDHGRFIQLLDSGWIEIFASFTRDTDLPLPSVLFEGIKYIEQDADSVSFILNELSSTYLGKLHAFHYLAKYEKKGKSRIAEGIIALSKHENIQFSIMLDTESSNYSNDVMYFKSIYKSWQRIKRH